MIFSSICVQINTMFTKKEFKVAAVIALFYSVPSRFMRKIVCRLRLSEVSRQ